MAEQRARQERPSHAVDTVSAIFKHSGTTTGTIQEDQAAVQRPGDMVLLNRRPLTVGSPEAYQSYVIELPRQRLERIRPPLPFPDSRQVCAASKAKNRICAACAKSRCLRSADGQGDREAASGPTEESSRLHDDAVPGARISDEPAD